MALTEKERLSLENTLEQSHSVHHENVVTTSVVRRKATTPALAGGAREVATTKPFREVLALAEKAAKAS